MLRPAASSALVALVLATACYDDGTPPRRTVEACQRVSCEDAGATCGTIPDGCGGVLECGDCGEGETCGGGGEPNACGRGACTPSTCAALGAACGLVGDGCGSALECGGCPAGAVCGGGGTANQCGGTCAPRSCDDAGAECGAVPDGCGGTLDCGGCGAGETCGGGGAENVCGSPPGEPGGETRWVEQAGGLGREHVQGIDVRDDGVTVALTVIGGTSDRPDALGLVWIGRDGRVLGDRVYPVRGALGFPRQPIAVSPLGNVFVAFQAVCEDEGCPDLGGGALSGGVLVKLSAEGDPVWVAQLPGALASNVAADGAGGAIVASAAGGDRPVRLHRFEWNGRVGWEADLDPALAAAVAFAPDGGVVVGQGLAVRALTPAGGERWRADLGGGSAAITGVGATTNGTVVVAGLHAAEVTLAGAGLPVPGGAGAGAFLAAFRLDGAPLWLASAGPARAERPAGAGLDLGLAVSPGGWIGLLVGGAGCDLRAERWSVAGERLWSRGFDAPGCAGAALFGTGIDVAPADDLVVSGGFGTPVDLGRGGLLEPRGERDGFVVGLVP